MLTGTEPWAERAATIEPFVVAASPSLADDTAKAVRLLDTYQDEQYREPSVQAEVTRFLAAQVPGWQTHTEQLRATFAEHGVVLVRGLRFDPENRLLVGTLAALGQITGEGNPSLHAVHDLFPIERPPDTPDFELYFHTGSYFRTRPHEVLALLCVRPGIAGGGVSRLAQVDAVCDSMRRRGDASAIETLIHTPALFKRPIRKGRGYFEAPILTRSPEHPERLHVRYERRRVERGAKGRPGGYGPELQAAIDAFEAAMYAPESFIEYALRQDELLIIDNRRALHARTAVVGGAASGRHLKRVKAYLRGAQADGRV